MTLKHRIITAFVLALSLARGLPLDIHPGVEKQSWTLFRSR